MKHVGRCSSYEEINNENLFYLLIDCLSKNRNFFSIDNWNWVLLDRNWFESFQVFSFVEYRWENNSKIESFRLLINWRSDCLWEPWSMKESVTCVLKKLEWIETEITLIVFVFNYRVNRELFPSMDNAKCERNYWDDLVLWPIVCSPLTKESKKSFEEKNKKRLIDQQTIDNWTLFTWESVFTACWHVPFVLFQKRKKPSECPPPVAKSFEPSHGHQAIA